MCCEESASCRIGCLCLLAPRSSIDPDMTSPGLMNDPRGTHTDTGTGGAAYGLQGTGCLPSQQPCPFAFAPHFRSISTAKVQPWIFASIKLKIPINQISRCSTIILKKWWLEYIVRQMWMKFVSRKAILKGFLLYSWILEILRLRMWKILINRIKNLENQA